MKKLIAVSLVLTSIGVAACGSTKTVVKTITTPAPAKTVTAPPTTPDPSTTPAPSTASAITPTAPEANSTTSTNSAAAQNDAVIGAASQAPDAQAQLGAAKVRTILVAKLGLNDTLSFNLSHHIAPGDNGGDCYVKLGADAVNFENMTDNILRSPTSSDIVFVQSNTATPLVKCLVAVKGALGW
jgi:hypothetical protein